MKIFLDQMNVVVALVTGSFEVLLCLDDWNHRSPFDAGING